MLRRFTRLRSLLVSVMLVALSACHVYDLPLWGPLDPVDTEPCAVEKIKDIEYRPGPEANPYRRRLDLFLPRGRHDFPVVVMVHGGAWIISDNRGYGLHTTVGEFLASQGIAAVLPNYRLSPGVKHPEHVREIAQAVAWTKKHIAEYGGSPDRLFLLGHSAGGHLVALLATDEQYLREQGLHSSDVRGVVAVSGVYHIPPGKVHGTLGGTSPDAFHLDELVPVRDPRAPSHRLPLPGVPLDVNVYGLAFGQDPKVRADASPVNHVRPGLPPFLLINGDHDLPTLAAMTDEFQHALIAQGCDVQVLKVKNRNHNSVMFHAVTPDDPVAQAILEFVRRYGQSLGAPPAHLN